MALWKAMEKPRSPQSKLPFPESQTPYRRTRPDSTKIVWPGFSLYDSTFLAALDIILQEIKKLHFSLVLKAKMQLFNGAGMGTRTPTPEAREPKSRMSTNSIMPAFRENASIFTRGGDPRQSKLLYPQRHTQVGPANAGNLYPWILRNSTIPGPMGQ